MKQVEQYLSVQFVQIEYSINDFEEIKKNGGYSYDWIETPVPVELCDSTRFLNQSQRTKALQITNN